MPLSLYIPKKSTIIDSPQARAYRGSLPLVAEFIMVKRSWLLIAALPPSISPSPRGFYYRQQEKGTVYVVEQKGEKDEILSELPDINFSRLWRIANLANKQDSRLLSDFNPDKFDCDDEGDCEHAAHRWTLCSLVWQSPEKSPVNL